jgi:glycerol dehydrogenase-like iron-containing ADH family enzyme
MDVVEAILSTPITVNVFGVGKAVACGAAHIWHKDGEPAQSEMLYQLHGEPGEIGAFLALRATVDVIDNWTRAFETEFVSRLVQPG